MRKSVRPVLPTGNGKSVSLGRLGDFVGFRLRRLENQVSRDFALATADRNLRSGLFSSLALIAANPGISQNELSKETALDKSVIVTIVDDLERRGWATREQSRTDRRRNALFITKEGDSYLNELFEILEHIEDSFLRQLSPADLHMLHELLDRMYTACLREEGKEEA